MQDSGMGTAEQAIKGLGPDRTPRAFRIAVEAFAEVRKSVGPSYRRVRRGRGSEIRFQPRSSLSDSLDECTAVKCIQRSYRLFFARKPHDRGAETR